MSDDSSLVGVAGPCPVTGEAICRCGLKEDDPDRAPVDKIFEADDQGGTIQGSTFEFSVLEGLSTEASDGFLLSDGNRDIVEFVGGDDVIKDFELGVDVVEIDLPGLEVAEPSASTKADFLAVIEAATTIALSSPAGSPTLEAYICEHEGQPADLVLVIRDGDGKAAHSAKLIGLAGEIGVEDLEAAGAIVDEHDPSSHDHGTTGDGGDHSGHHGDGGELVIENNNAFLMAMGEGSRIEIHAADAAKESWTQLAETVRRGDTELVFTEDTGWEVGDVIAIAPSGQNYREDEVRTIAAISEDGRTVTLDEAVEFTHLGEVLSYTNGTDNWDVDMRAEVGLLSRNVTIQGDADSADDGYGAHTMVMHGATQHISGAEFTRVGQIDELGRYPIHWHMLGDAAGQYVQDVSVHQSFNKGATIHGTFNILFEDNVLFDHIGHGFFLEDGSEYGTQVLGNLVFGTHASKTGDPIPTDRSDVSSYWIENLSNTFIGNHAAGSQDNGFFIAPTKYGPHGLSADVFPDVPSKGREMVFRDNAAHSNDDGYWADGFIRPGSLVWKRDGIGTNLLIEDFTGYSNSENGIWVRGGQVTVDNAMLVENQTAVHWRGGVHQITDSVIANDTDLRFNDVTRHGSVSNYKGAMVGYDNVLFEDMGTAVRHRGGGSDGQQQLFAWYNDVTYKNVNQKVVWTWEDTDVGRKTRLLDLDGSLSGTAGGFVTTEAYSSPDLRAGYEYHDATAADKLGNAVVTTEGVLASGVISYRNQEATRVQLTRSDGMEYPEIAPDYGRFLAHQHFLVATGAENEALYLAEFKELPRVFSLEIDGIRIDEPIIFQFPNVAEFSVRQAWVTRSETLEEFFASEVTTTFLKDGNLFVRVIGVPLNPDGTFHGGITNSENPAAEFMGHEGVGGLARTTRNELTGLQFTLTEVDNPVAYGEAEFDPEVMAALAETDGFGKSEIKEVPEIESREAHESYASTSDTVDVTDSMPRWSDDALWGGEKPGPSDIIVIGAGKTVVLDQSVTVKGIIVDGGNLIIEDAPGGPDNAIKLISDYILVIGGGLFQAGTEDDPLNRDFTLELTGDDPDFDLEVTKILNGEVDNTIFAEDVIEAPVVPIIPVDPVDSAPAENAAEADLFEVQPYATTILDVLANDGEGLRIVEVSGPGAQFVEIIDGELHYTPDHSIPRTTVFNPEYMFKDVFTYTAVDASGAQHSAEVVVEVEHRAQDNPLPTDSAWLEMGSTEISQERVSDWMRIDFEIEIPDAVVVAGPLSYNGAQEATVSVRNVDSKGFEIRIDEWDYLDGVHTTETVSWMAVTRGTHQLNDGTIIEAGTTIARNEQRSEVDFSDAFDDAPIVFSQVMSANGAQAVTTRNWDVTAEGFSVRMQEEEANDGFHVPEQIGWIAVERSDGIEDGTKGQALNTSSQVMDHHLWTETDLQFDGVIFADMQTMNGGNTATLRYQETSSGELELKVDEEQSRDQEKWHRKEEVALLVAQEGLYELDQISQPTEFDFA